MKNVFLSIVILLFVLGSGQLSAQWRLTSLNNAKDTTRNICSITTNGANIFAGTAGGKLYRSTDNGLSWVNILSLSTVNNILKIYSIGTAGNNVFVGTDRGVYLSRDSGDTWREALSINKTVFTIAINGTNVFAGTSQGLYLSTNNGISWKLVENILTNARILTLSLNNTGIFAGVAGSSIPTGGIYFSSDMGGSWKLLLSSNSSVLTLQVSGTNIFAGTDVGNVYLSTNNGTAWTLVNAGVVYSLAWSVAISGNNIYSATQFGGLYLSTDFGKTWGMEGDRLIFDQVTSLGINDQYIYIGTLDKGLWRRLISDLLLIITSVESENSSNIPCDYQLEQNYPNPFNPITKIRFNISDDCYVRLTVCNTLGQEIATLINKELSGASYSINFDASHLPSGIYLYKLQAGEYIATKKMLLIK